MERGLLADFVRLLSHLSACSSDTQDKRGGGGGASAHDTNGSVVAEGKRGVIISTARGARPVAIRRRTTRDLRRGGANRAYVGGDFWPTIVANPVYVDFDPAVVVANGGHRPGQNHSRRAERVPAGGDVAAGALQTILPQVVPDLKGRRNFVTNTSGGASTIRSASTRGPTTW